MIEEHHDLAHEFPEYKEKIHELKISDAHFRKLFDEYEALNHEIHGIETHNQNVSDEHAEELKKKRLTLKDELFHILKG